MKLTSLQRLAFVFIAAFNVSARCSSNLIEELRVEIPRTATRFEEAYRNVQIRTTETQYDAEGKFLWQAHCDYTRSDDRLKKVRTVIKSSRPDMPVGYVSVSGGNSAKYFIIGKKPDDESFAIAEFGAKTPDEFSEIGQLSFRPLFAPLYADLIRIEEYLSFSWVRVVSAREVEFEGRTVIDVVLQEDPPGGPKSLVHLYFHSGSWSFAGITQPLLWPKQTMSDPHKVMEIRVAYSDDDPLRIRSFRRWMHPSRSADIKNDLEEISVDSVVFASAPDRQFTLGSYGLEEPGSVGSGSRGWLYFFIVNGISCAVLGVWFSILANRRKRKRA